MVKVKPRTLAAIGRWGMLLPAFVILLAAGIAKFTGRENWHEDFVGWGYPAWMSDVTGVLEIAAALLMLPYVTRFYGAALGVGVMLGAAVTRLVAAEYGAVVAPIVVAVFAGITAWWARPVWLDRMVHRPEADEADEA